MNNPPFALRTAPVPTYPPCAAVAAAGTRVAAGTPKLAARGLGFRYGDAVR